MLSSGPRHPGADACPGALRLHTAADGPLARVRLPGGRLTGAQLRAVRELAEEFGDGHAELTSRGNLQLRALTGASPSALASRLAAAGLLPSESHELVRNILASPLGGSLPVRELDLALCADPELAGLPGRFLFALDDGSLDVAGAADAAAVPAAALRPSASATMAGDAGERIAAASGGGAEASHGLTATADGGSAEASHGLTATADGGGAGASLGLTAADGPGGAVAILVGGVDAGLRVGAGQAVPALLAVARAFLAVRGAADLGGQDGGDLGRSGGGRAGGGESVWRVRDLPDGAARVAARTALELGVELGSGRAVPSRSRRGLVGLLADAGRLVALGAAVPLGRLSGVQMKVLEEAEAIVVTPWRGVVLPGLSPEAAAGWAPALAAVGLEVESGSRWAGVTSCAGRPGCAKALADVRRDAAATVAGLAAESSVLPVHWVGCARGCGSPDGPHVRVEATAAGYLVRAPRGSNGGSGAAGDVITGEMSEVGALVAVARRN